MPHLDREGVMDVLLGLQMRDILNKEHFDYPLEVEARGWIIAGIDYHLFLKMPDVLDGIAHSGEVSKIGVENLLRNSHSRISSERGESEIFAAEGVK